MAILKEENSEMRKGMAGLDIGFFEEIEDLKHEHHVLKHKYAELQQESQMHASRSPPSVLTSI